jgi:histidinol dehydrogenase
MQHARYIVTEDLQQSIAVSNQYAPEHLIVQVENAGQWLSDIKNAGSVFLGAWSPESVGDYASGTNHVLPTYGYARNSSSLGTLDFMRRYTVQELTKQALERLGNTVMQLAQAEGLDAHRNAVAIRLEEPQ